MNKLILLTVAFIILLFGGTMGQATTCAESEPICTGPEFTFAAGTTGSAEPGAYYGCLSTQPAPAWFHMLIEDPGDVTIYMYSTPLVDIDFICWGPFTDPVTPCVEGLTSYTVVDCSYSPNPTEYCDIYEGETGQYYIMMITNYSQQPAQISFSQTAGNGSLDCSLVNFIDVAFSASPTQGPLPLNVSFTDQSTGEPSEWKWDFENDGVYDAFVQNPYFQYTEAGTYSVKLWVSNEWETDSIVYIDYITVREPDIQVIPAFLTIYQEPLRTLPGLAVSDTLATVSINNTGDYVLSINSIQLSEEWLLIDGFPPTPFSIDPGESQEILIDINWHLLEGQSETTSIVILSSDPDEPVVNVTVTATPLSLPDLSIYEPFVLPEQVYAGDEIMVYSAVQNLGFYEAGENYTGYFLSADTLFDTGDTGLGTKLTRSLPPGDITEQADTLTIPGDTEHGDWYILFVADTDHQVDETDESNNVGFAAFSVDTATSMEDGTNEDLFEIYPNPAKNAIYMKYSGPGNEAVEVEIFDSKGSRQAVYSFTNADQGSCSISCKDWLTGVYLFRIHTGGKTFLRKIVVGNR